MPDLNSPNNSSAVVPGQRPGTLLGPDSLSTAAEDTRSNRDAWPPTAGCRGHAPGLLAHRGPLRGE